MVYSNQVNSDAGLLIDCMILGGFTINPRDIDNIHKLVLYNAISKRASSDSDAITRAIRIVECISGMYGIKVI